MIPHKTKWMEQEKVAQSTTTEKKKKLLKTANYE